MPLVSRCARRPTAVVPSNIVSVTEDATFTPAKLMTWLGSATCGTDKINGHGAMVPLWFVHNSLNRSPDPKAVTVCINTKKDKPMSQ